MGGDPDDRDRNPGTQLPHVLARGAARPSLREHFARLGPELHAPSAPGYQVFATDGPHLRSVHLPPVASAFAVVGRHEACDLAVVSAASVCLRHVLLRAVSLEQGGVALRVIDLATPQGFETDDDVALTAVVVEGPFAFRIGSCAVFAIPWGAAVSRELPAPASRRSLVVPRLLAPSVPLPDRPPPAEWQTRVTLVPPPSSMAPAIDDALGERVLRLRSRGEGFDVPRSLATLASGVLLGRYGRCDPAATRLMGGEISRVHALLLHEGGDDLIFDLASTNGISHGGARVRRAVLADGDRVALAPRCDGSLQMTWRHGRADRPPIVWH
jgi:hypothetical protein